MLRQVIPSPITFKKEEKWTNPSIAARLLFHLLLVADSVRGTKLGSQKGMLNQVR